MSSLHVEPSRGVLLRGRIRPALHDACRAGGAVSVPATALLPPCGVADVLPGLKACVTVIVTCSHAPGGAPNTRHSLQPVQT